MVRAVGGWLGAASGRVTLFGVAGERIGACNMVTGSEREAECVRSQLKLIARATFSNPPIHGALIVSIVSRRFVAAARVGAVRYARDHSFVWLLDQAGAGAGRCRVDPPVVRSSFM